MSKWRGRRSNIVIQGMGDENAPDVPVSGAPLPDGHIVPFYMKTYTVSSVSDTNEAANRVFIN